MKEDRPLDERLLGSVPALFPGATLFGYVTALIGAELVALFSIWASLVVYAGLLLVLLTHALLPSTHGEIRAALASLALVPLLKIAAVALPQKVLSDVYWEALPAAAVLVTVVLLRRVIPSAGRVASWPARPHHGWRAQFMIATTGPLLAVAAALFLAAIEPATAGPGFAGAPVSVLAVAGFSGSSLEVVFRGVIQPSLVSLVGPPGLVLVAGLYGGLFLGSGSVFVILVGLGTGLAWGLLAFATRTAVGVAVAHALFSVSWVLLY